MKAKVKATGRIVDVDFFPDKDYGTIWREKDGTGIGEYRNVELEFHKEDWNVINWEERRYEIAKAALNGLLASANPNQDINVKAYIKTSAELADELIKELNGDPNHVVKVTQNGDNPIYIENIKGNVNL